MTKISDFFVEEHGVDYTGEIESKEVIISDDKLPLFRSHNNPNHDIFIIETQEGSDKEDQGHGSIGDATMEHVSKMRHKLLEMEHFFCMPNGNLFRVENNVQSMDEDGKRYNEQQMMQVLMSKDKKCSAKDKENLINFLQEEIDERRRARQEKEDALDQVTVPYDDWEAMPQMTKDWNVPSTPPPLYIYAGTTNQMFYDVFPEGHPDAKNLNAFISMANAIDWDDFNNYTVQYFFKWLENQYWEIPTCIDYLKEFCDKVSSNNITGTPDDHMIAALQKIDQEWADARNKMILRDFYETPVMKEIIEFEKKLSARPSGNLTWGEIGNFGKTLYKKYGREVATAHWNKYRQLKSKYAPEVRIGKIDVNKASIQDMVKFFMRNVNLESKNYYKLKKLAEKKAEKIFFLRPFMSLEDLVKLKLIQADDIGHTSKNVVMITMIKKARLESIQNGNLAPLGELSQTIINNQKKRADMMSQEEWSAVWQTYRISKREVQNALGL